MSDPMTTNESAPDPTAGERLPRSFCPGGEVCDTYQLCAEKGCGRLPRLLPVDPPPPPYQPYA